MEEERPYEASRIKELVRQEIKRIEATHDSEGSDWTTKVIQGAYRFIDVANGLKPVIDIFVPHSPEYSVPYACVWIIFKGFLARKDKKDSVPKLIKDLSQDIDIFEAYKDLVPTDDMKITLAELYIHSADLLWRLAKYYSSTFWVQLTDGLLPRAKYNFDLYRENVKTKAERLKTLFDLGTMARLESINQQLGGIPTKLDALSTLLESRLRANINVVSNNILAEISLISKRMEDERLAQAQHQAADLIDIWHDDVREIEHELQMWDGLRFLTAPRDHWNHNGIVAHLSEWRELCDKSQTSVFWTCSEGNGRQAWMTEFSLALVRVCQSQGQPVTFALCDRPKGERWSPQQVLKQLVAQLLYQSPKIVLANPSVFNRRGFHRANNFRATLDLLVSVISVLESLVIVIDRLDRLDPGPAERHLDMAQALSMLVSKYPDSLRIVVSSAGLVGPRSLPGLPISFAKITTRRRPRRRYADTRPNDNYDRRMIIAPAPRTKRPNDSGGLYTVEYCLIPHG